MDFDDLDTKAIIRPYFDALYKGIEEFNRQRRTEGDSRSGDNDRLRSQAAAAPFDPESNWLFMDKEGLNYAVNKIMQENPELHEEFEELPPGLRYDFLQQEFEVGFRAALSEQRATFNQDYVHKTLLGVDHSKKEPDAHASPDSRREWEERQKVLKKEADAAKGKFLKHEAYMESGDLVSADVAFAAEKQLRELFPELVEQRDFGREIEFEKRLKQDPEKLYVDTMEEFAFRYLGMLGGELNGAEQGVENAKRALAGHDDNPPCVLQNIVSLGGARKAWLEKREALANEIDRRIDAVSKIEALREEARDGCVFEAVRDWVTGQIALKHPALVAACAEREKEHWEQIKQARLGSREADERSGGEELAPEHGMAR